MSNILIVDDDEFITESCEKFLKRAGYGTAVAGNGKVALDVLSKSHYDLILLDLLMPEMDGVKLIEEIQKNQELDIIPIIMISAAPNEMDLVKGMLERQITYIQKPFSSEKLLGLIEKKLQKK